MDFRKSSNFSTRKRVRRRSHTRKMGLDGIVNMAEARREIASALQLHRSATSNNESSLGKDINGVHHQSFSYGTTHVNNKTTILSASQQYYYPLHESIPAPEPIWSTTAPVVLAVPPPGDIVELIDWADNSSSSSSSSSLSSSYAWWSSFLNSLDGKINSTTEMLQNHSFKENVLAENSDGEKLEGPVMDISDQNPFPDEWLIVPTAEDSTELL